MIAVQTLNGHFSTRRSLPSASDWRVLDVWVTIRRGYFPLWGLLKRLKCFWNSLSAVSSWPTSVTRLQTEKSEFHITIKTSLTRKRIKFFYLSWARGDIKWTRAGFTHAHISICYPHCISMMTSATGRLEDSGRQNDEKKSGETVHSQSYATFFRHSAVLSVECSSRPAA